MTLDDSANVMWAPGHLGRHPEMYHLYVLQRIEGATEGLQGIAYRKAVIDVLGNIRREILANPKILHAQGWT